MTLRTVGTTTCPVCETTQRVFQRGFYLSNKPVYAISLHWLGDTYCPGQGRRVSLRDVTK